MRIIQDLFEFILYGSDKMNLYMQMITKYTERKLREENLSDHIILLFCFVIFLRTFLKWRKVQTKLIQM